jgi:predicted nucleotidyltransferase
MVDRPLRELEGLLAAAGQDPDVLAVILFGSAGRGEPGRRSDVDVCLVLAPERAGRDRAALTRKRLDYVQDFPVDVQVFQGLPLFIRRRVLKEGRVLLVKDESRLYEVACRTAQAFEDFRPAYEDYLAQVARGRS